MAENRKISLPVQELDATAAENQDWKISLDLIFKS